MARYGYVRASSTDQDYATQEGRLRDAGCEVIRTEKASGKSRDGRDELARIMDFLHAGDELVVVKLDRLVLQPGFAHCSACGGGGAVPCRAGAKPRTGLKSWRRVLGGLPRSLGARSRVDAP